MGHYTIQTSKVLEIRMHLGLNFGCVKRLEFFYVYRIMFYLLKGEYVQEYLQLEVLLGLIHGEKLLYNFQSLFDST